MGENNNADALQKEHDHIRESLGQLASAVDRVQMSSLLSELTADLKSHFLVEEHPQKGLSSIVAASAPHYMKETGVILAEHSKILKFAEQLMAEISSAPNLPLDDIIPRAEALIQMIRSHEKKETELMSLCLVTDIGACD